MKSLSEYIPRFTDNPLTYRTLGYVLLSSTVLALIATSIQLFTEYRRDMANLQDNARLIEQSYLKPISTSLYKIDSDHLKLELEGLLNLANIVYAEVIEQRGNEIIKISMGEPDRNNLVQHEFPLIYSDESIQTRRIGTLKVASSLDEIHHRLLSRVLIVLATNTTKTFFASAIVLSIIYLMITRHLMDISLYTQMLQPGKKSSPLVLKRKKSQGKTMDELDRLAASINDLCNRVYEAIATLEAYDKERSRAERKYRTVANFTHDWEYWINEAGVFEYISPSCHRISGYTQQNYKDTPQLIQEIIVPEDQNIWTSHSCDKKNFQEGVREIQFRIQRKDGQIVWLEHVCQPVSDDSGKQMGVRVSNRDITCRKIAEIRLQDTIREINRLKNQLESEKSFLQTEIKLEHDHENIIGNSPALKYVLYKIEQVASVDATVLVLGESGTGKELIARAIHDRSPQGKRSLIKLNCSAIPSELIESTLFGHERGSFTGADSTQLGRFEIADGSSIFLDEIGELPLELQSKLLRVLQEGEIERLGSSRTIKVKVRIIAATNRNLEKEVREGRFREDLYFRLNVFPITAPPLRERIEDIPLLTQYFVKKIAKRLNKQIEKIPEGVIRKFQAYSWPGNVRELMNVIERAVISNSGNKLQLVDKLTEKPNEHKRSKIQSLEELEKSHILKVLQLTKWRIEGDKGAAIVLQMNPSTLRSRMRKLNISKA